MAFNPLVNSPTDFIQRVAIFVNGKTFCTSRVFWCRLSPDRSIIRTIRQHERVAVCSVQRHVHATDADGVVEIEGVKHAVVKVPPEFRVTKDLRVPLSEILPTATRNPQVPAAGRK
jgi:hypothetical protein